MLRRHHQAVQRVLVYFDILLAFASFLAAMRIRQALHFEGYVFRVGATSQVIQASAAICFLAVLYRMQGLYHSQRAISLLGEARRLLTANVICLLLLLALSAATRLEQVSRVQLLIFTGVNSSLAIGSRLAIRGLARTARRRGLNFRNLLLVPASERSLAIGLQRLAEHPEWGYRVLAIVPPSAGAAADEAPEEAAGASTAPRIAAADAAALLDRQPVDEIWVEGFPIHSVVQDFLAAASTRGATVRYVLPNNLLPGTRWDFKVFGPFTTITAARTPLDELALLVKSSMDLVLSALALLIAAPILLVAAGLILLQDGAPVIFRQQRLGLHGRPFTMYKLRTMYRDAEARRAELLARNEMKGAAFKIKNDPRITPVGRWLRRFSIDEIPQLWNVLKGDMSLVGPRPPLPEEVNMYEPAQRRRLSVRPGVTGYWQVKGRSGIADFDRWVELDLEYIDRWSLRLDLSILLRTIPAVLFMRGAR